MLVGPHGFCHTRRFNPTLEKTSRPRAEVAAFAFLGGVAWSDTLAARGIAAWQKKSCGTRPEGKSARSKRGPDGILVAKDLSGKKVGEYDPDNDVTRDGRGRKVGVGDQLSGCYPPTAEPRLNGLSRLESSDCRN